MRKMRQAQGKNVSWQRILLVKRAFLLLNFTARLWQNFEKHPENQEDGKKTF